MVLLHSAYRVASNKPDYTFLTWFYHGWLIWECHCPPPVATKAERGNDRKQNQRLRVHVSVHLYGHCGSYISKTTALIHANSSLIEASLCSDVQCDSYSSVGLVMGCSWAAERARLAEVLHVLAVTSAWTVHLWCLVYSWPGMPCLQCLPA